MYNPDINDYQLTSIITECCGGVAVVYSALYKPNNQNVAIKRYFVDKTKENANLIQVIFIINDSIDNGKRVSAVD